MKTKHDELILLLQTLLEKAEFLGHSTNVLEYGVCYDQVRPVIKRIENYLFAHPEIPFSDENRNLLSPDQAYDKFPVSLKNAAFLLQRAVISREDDNSGKADAGRDNTKRDNRNSPTAENISGTIQALQLLKLSQQDYWKAYAALGKEGKLSEKQQDYSDYVKPSLDIAKAYFEDFQLYYYIQHYGTGQLKTVKSINLLLDGQGVSDDTAIDELIKELEAVEQHLFSQRINPLTDARKDETPKVFISYSHDSSKHKKWVLDLAIKLCENGVDVILDQWDLRLGGDVAKFMESSTDTDRVLMICTESYVKKADEGKGGVGYEAMIVTGELLRNLGTTKFIPVIRQNSGEIKLPKSISTRAYINLSDNQSFEQEFKRLLRDLHQLPAVSKPPLGKNPFNTQPSSKDDGENEKTRGASGEWQEVADGIKMKVVSTEQVLKEHPELQPCMPVSAQTILNGTILSFQQLEFLKDRLGQLFTLGDVKTFYKKNRLDFEDATWSEVCELVNDSSPPKNQQVIINTSQEQTGTNKNYYNYLLGIAGQVNFLIEQNRGRFIQQVKEFEGRFYHWQVEFRKAYQDAKDKPYLRYNENERKSRKIPAEYIFYDINKELYYNADEDGKFSFYGLPISLNPVDTLRKRCIFDLVFESKDKEIIARKPSDTVEDLLRKYYLLSVIHAFKGYGCTVLENVDIKSLDESVNEPAMLVWGAYEDNGDHINNETEKRTLIETAVDSVRQDMETILVGKNKSTDLSGGGAGEKEIIEIKPGWFGISIDLKEVGRRIKKKFRR